MNVLVVEDNAEKCRQLIEFLNDEFRNLSIETRLSYRSGLAAIREDPPGIVLLDMSMPTYDRSGTERGGRTRVYAGRDILREMQRLELASKAIVVTMFETFREEGQERTLIELQRELAAEFPQHYVGTVYYHASRSDWRQKLRGMVSASLPGVLRTGGS